MDFQHYNMEEQTMYTEYSGKRSRDEYSYDRHGSAKAARLSKDEGNALTAHAIASPLSSSQGENTAPYFSYRDFSRIPDPDPLTPLTAPGRVPNFPAKMHAILSRPDLADIVAWMPHGRSWRVLKPREFEVRVIPTYFEHAKFSSFIRQANGWGFRRITQGRDRNSYYHELFIRGLPHLCKQMKRPAAYEKPSTDPEQEPDFYRISMERPVPDKPALESVLLNNTLHAGPKARMPIRLTSPAPAVPITARGLSANVQISQSGFVQQAASPQPAPVHATPAAPIQYGFPHQPIFYPFHMGTNISHMPIISCSGDTAASPQFAAGFAAAATLNQQQFSNILSQAVVSHGNHAR